ncbi:hypothetical protein PIB30_101828 [Stylosanthes scabra]|uniref:Uncharacterized protein n=1 Tax=Stylosanthes scabra TaxID=79078 RepID=A0ABU6QY52_9FABA|nr:hypothetical protein [Stylosanthes scabra]
MDEVLQVNGKEGATWWEDPRNPVIPTRPKKKILNYEAWMWLKLVVCNINPTRHETTLSMEIVLLIYAPMRDMPWREDDEEVALPVPPLAAPVDVPAPSAPSSPEPSRKELMRALRRNECIMHILSKNLLESAKSKSRIGRKRECGRGDDFRSTEATGDASTYAGEESTDDK